MKKQTGSSINCFDLLVVGILISLLFSSSAEAYIDPGTGSIALQMLIAGALGAGFAMKRFWRKIVEFLRSTFKS